jgi:SMC interacting uncharacterized protein involved in chromosome segregation
MASEDQPVTRTELREELTALESRIDGKLEDFKVEVNTRFHSFEHRMEQLLHDMEGRIITSTYRVAESLQARLTEEERESVSLKTRLGIMEARLLELEKRVNMPPGRAQ